jgi:hypothetical protein
MSEQVEYFNWAQASTAALGKKNSRFLDPTALAFRGTAEAVSFQSGVILTDIAIQRKSQPRADFGHSRRPELGNPPSQALLRNRDRIVQVHGAKGPSCHRRRSKLLLRGHPE